jgi:hypothetical protein
MLPPAVTAAPQPVVAPGVAPNVAGRWRGRPAPVGNPATGWGTATSPVASPAALKAGGCCAWPLSLDATCAREARHIFAEAVSGLGLSDDQVHDGVTMASELAANTLHAQENAAFDGMAGWPEVGAPELWLYVRRFEGRWELVCKVFDSLAGWKSGSLPRMSGAASQAVSGRGLQVVAGLSGGRWGHHLTRSRLGGWKVPGKVVWFAQPVPADSVPAPVRRARLRPCQASRRLEAMLTDRGLGGSLLRAEEAGAGISVLSVRRGLTIWCRADKICWRTRAGSYEQRMLTDLEDTVEQIVCHCEELDCGYGAGYAGRDRVR